MLPLAIHQIQCYVHDQLDARVSTELRVRRRGRVRPHRSTPVRRVVLGGHPGADLLASRGRYGGVVVVVVLFLRDPPVHISGLLVVGEEGGRRGAVVVVVLVVGRGGEQW